MDAEKIFKLQKLNDEINNFRSCYSGNELWGRQDGPVSAETLIAFLIDNPHFQQIAERIKELDA